MSDPAEDAALKVKLGILKRALVEIRDRKNQVCEDYELCSHPVCAASYEAYVIADIALKKLGEK